MTEIEQTFKIGDVVTLKSGGQKMTVVKMFINGKTKTYQGLVDCQWFIGNGLKTATFNQNVLELITE